MEQKKPKAKPLKVLKRLLIIGIIFAAVAEMLLYMRPLPDLQPTAEVKNPAEGNPVALPWPAYGQSAIGAQGFGVLGTSGEQKAAPIASVAKVMTAYSVLKQKPLAAGQQGPSITITDQDVLIYNDYVSKGGSSARVVAGEKISEYQALQALMLPSANNFASTLATWAFGSTDKYIAYANNQAKELGLKDTHISDASGFSPETLSSARDLVVLGEETIKNPVIAEIVSQKEATIPEAGTVHNVNWLLGVDNVNGIKTGNTDQAMGCFLFSSERNIGGQKVTIVGAIMGAPDLNAAISGSRPLINASDSGFENIQAVKAGQVVGYYNLPWGGRVQAAAKKDLSFFVWKGQKAEVTAKLNTIKSPEAKGAVVGSLSGKTDKNSASTEVVLAQPLPKPSWKWRVFSR
jgi:D-alanyl-D-alanine carboxypeptidase (penicillin-binding protein 5/6)